MLTRALAKLDPKGLFTIGGRGKVIEKERLCPDDIIVGGGRGKRS